MPGTIKFNYDLYVENGSHRNGPTIVRKDIVQTGVGGPNPGSVTVTTGGITLTTGLTNLGVAKITNHDPTNYVDVGPHVSGTTHPLVRIKPGESWVMRFGPGVTVGALANAASCKVSFEIFED